LAKVVLHFSMSLDGFVAGPEISAEHPMGQGGERLHEWMFGAVGPEDRRIMDETHSAAGAVVLGKRTFDIGVGLWGDTPYPAPSFVLGHEGRAPLVMKSAAFTFVGDGIESAIAMAKAAAGERDVVVMGACTAQQALAAGLADELRLQLVPVLMGAGSRLFDNLGNDHIELVRTRVVPSSSVTHLDFRVRR
jgi:dihydrofolate reductase